MNLFNLPFIDLRKFNDNGQKNWEKKRKKKKKTLLQRARSQVGLQLLNQQNQISKDETCLSYPFAQIHCFYSRAKLHPFFFRFELRMSNSSHRQPFLE